VIFCGYPAGAYTDSAPFLITDRRMLARKVQDGSELAARAGTQLAGKLGWQPTGSEMKYVVDHDPSEEEVRSIIDFFLGLRADIIARGTVSTCSP
jgi:hypothetical protein